MQAQSTSKASYYAIDPEYEDSLRIGKDLDVDIEIFDSKISSMDQSYIDDYTKITKIDAPLALVTFDKSLSEKAIGFVKKKSWWVFEAFTSFMLCTCMSGDSSDKFQR